MHTDHIEIIGAHENNLKHVHVRIPKHCITIFTGVSGSGKSSIVFDTIAQEAGRQLNETYPSFTRLFLPRYSRPAADEISGLSTAIVIDQKRLGGNARSTLGTITDINALLRLLFSRFGTPSAGYANAYSFNDPSGMCPTCEGIGKVITLNVDAAIDLDKSLQEGAILLPFFEPGSYYWKTVAESGLFDPDKKLRDYSETEMHTLLHADPQRVVVDHGVSGIGATFEGLAVRFLRTNVKTEKETSKSGEKRLAQFTVNCTCPTCEGKRYNEKVLASKIDGYSMYDLTAMQVDALLPIVRAIDMRDAAPVLDGIAQRLESLCDIGLGYLTLTRETATLSGGESQRVKMVKHLASSLTGMLYIFDEPSIGLHPRDVYRLNDLLRRLRDKGNTVLVVEHDPDVIQIADHIIDVGPHAGAGGGQIMYDGSYEGLLTSGTLTGDFLARRMPINESPRTPSEFLESRPSALHNLKNVALRVPKGLFTAVTGVAGSGKSTLVEHVFLQDFPEAVWIDQNPLHANKRSNPATFTGILGAIRKCFGDANGVSESLFSANSEGGCETCHGTGTVELNLSFMDKMEVICSTCDGNRFKAEVLGYTYKGKNIVDVMAMTVEEAHDFFEDKGIRAKLKGLKTVGLHYLTLGQPLSTISGGEAQRLKLARELSKQGNIYILDEPTTGLHMSDVENILAIIDALVRRGNTVLVIEHNMDVVRRSDWVVDLGPDGGTGGGHILYEGPPAGMVQCEASVTGKFL